MTSKVYCKGLLCKVSERKIKCFDCGVYVCGNCSITTNKKRFCIDCFVLYHLPTSELITEDFFTDKQPIPY